VSAGSLTTHEHREIGKPAKLAACLAVLVPVLALLIAIAAVMGASLEGAPERSTGEAQPSALARAEIPAVYLGLYERAAQRYGLDWAILAGIGKEECDHGRDRDRSCRSEGATNAAGAGGPMQFLAQTWARYGVDGDGDGRSDRWDTADAIFAAANYLHASGAPGDYGRAIFAYNHAGWYVADVERWAGRYRGSALSDASSVALAVGGSGEEGAEAGGWAARLQAQTTTRVELIAGVRAELSPASGHQALIPIGAPPVVQAMLVAANELQMLPRGALEEDCSSTVNYVLYRSGIRAIAEIRRENPLALDYVKWGAPGPGRWVTIYATTSPTNHTFMTIAGLRLDTSHDGTDSGPNRAEDGPRWRILDRIPTWAHWSVRHPPGL